MHLDSPKSEGCPTMPCISLVISQNQFSLWLVEVEFYMAMTRGSPSPFLQLVQKQNHNKEKVLQSLQNH